MSFLLESSSRDTLDYMKLTAEFRQPERFRRDVLAAFSDALDVIYPDAPDELRDAIESGREWSDGPWHLTREPYQLGG